jgi:hypothetical protein
MTKSEQIMLTATSGATSKLQERLNDSILAFYSAMTAIGFPVSTPPNMVDRFRNETMAYAVWQWLLDMPQLKLFKTEERQKSYIAAQAALDKIANRLCGAIEPPTGYASFGNNWDSDPKIIGRMAGAPAPLLQFSNVGNPYPPTSNPNATSVGVQLLAPESPKNCWVFNGDAGILTVNWVMPYAAFVYNIFRGTTSGGETYLATVSNNNFYIDQAVTIGTKYFYYVVGINAVGQSPNSNEASATVMAVNT